MFVLGSSEMNCRTIDWPCVLFVLLLKLNNVLVCVNYVSILHLHFICTGTP